MKFGDWWRESPMSKSRPELYGICEAVWLAALSERGEATQSWKHGNPERRKDNWTLITAEERGRIGRRFKDHRGREFTFFGIVDGYDDYYYGMYSKEHGMVLSSCVGSIQTNGYEEIPSKSLEDEERERYERIQQERGTSAREGS